MFFSWDVMEPHSYMIGLGNMIIGLAYYTFSKRPFNLTAMFNFFRDRKKEKLLVKWGVNKKYLESLKDELPKLKEALFHHS